MRWDINDFWLLAFEVVSRKEDLVFRFCFCGSGRVLGEENFVVLHFGGLVGGQAGILGRHCVYVSMLRNQTVNGALNVVECVK